MSRLGSVRFMSDGRIALSLLQVVKRNGTIVDFDPQRIRTAVGKAFKASALDPDSDQFDQLITRIVDEIRSTFTEHSPGVEEIQDIVEKHLVESGMYEVSKRYILYRERRKTIREREQQDRLRRAAVGRLRVTKRDGRAVPFSFEKVETTLLRAAEGFSERISTDMVLRELQRHMHDAVSTADVSRYLLTAATRFIEHGEAYNRLASRLWRERLYREVLSSPPHAENRDSLYREAFSTGISAGIAHGVFSPRLEEFDLSILSEGIQPERDDFIPYEGVQLLGEHCLARIDSLIETPQAFWMRVAMALSVDEADREESALSFYQVLSTLRFLPGTPILLHAGRVQPQLCSTFATGVEDDLGSIFQVVAWIAELSRWSASVGNDWSRVRAEGSTVHSTGVRSPGTVPFLKIANDAVDAINRRGGNRRGTAGASLAAWHLDVEDFLDLHVAAGDQRRRASDIVTTVWIPDLLMKRVMSGEKWTLFSPNDVPDLLDLADEAFEKRYKEYEADADAGRIHAWRKVDADALFRKMVARNSETGFPRFAFSDTVYRHTPRTGDARLRCASPEGDIVLPALPGRPSGCVTGAVNLAAHITTRGLNRDLLATTVHIATRMLDNAIDQSAYPVPETRDAIFRDRSIGIGMIGLQDSLYRLRIPYQDSGAIEFAAESAELIAFHAICASVDLAAEKGTYPDYSNSRHTSGVLAPGPENRENRSSDGPNWDELRSRLSSTGMRNRTTTAMSPSRFQAALSGCVAGIEPTARHHYVLTSTSEEIAVTNPYLVTDLESAELWNDEILEILKASQGRVTKLSALPTDVRALYHDAFELDQLHLVKLVAAVQRWVDHCAPLPLFLASQPSLSTQEFYMTAWQSGVATTGLVRRE